MDTRQRITQRTVTVERHEDGETEQEEQHAQEAETQTRITIRRGSTPRI